LNELSTGYPGGFGRHQKGKQKSFIPTQILSKYVIIILKSKNSSIY